MTKALEFSLAINNCLGCCHCPQAALGKAYTSEKRKFLLEDFKTIVDKMPPDVELHFSGFNEAMLHPNFDEFLDYAANSGHALFLFTTLVGLNAKKLEAIKRASFAQIRLHCPNKTEFIYDNLKWLAFLDLFLTAKKDFTAMSLYPLEPELQKAISERGITVELPTILSRGGNLGWVAKGRPLKGRVTCNAERYRMNEVMPNGDTFLCCMDWQGKMPVGNILTQPYEALTAASEKYRLDLNPPDDSPCRSCDWAKSV